MTKKKVLDHIDAPDGAFAQRLRWQPKRCQDGSNHFAGWARA